MRRAFGFAIFFALLLILPLLAGGHAMAAAVVVQQDNTMVELDLHKGTLIKLDKPVSTVFVADAGIADVQVKSPRLIYLFGKTVGETTLYAVDGGENVVASMTVRINHNLSRLNDTIKAMGAGETVKARSVDKAIVIEGAVNSASLAADVQKVAANFINPKEESVVNRLSVDAPTQINLRVRVAEVKRSALKQLGFNWDAVFATGGLLLGLATGNPVLAAGNFFGADNILTRNNGTNSVFGSKVNSHFDVSSVVDALADEGLLSLLAEPNLTAVSGETASFLAGGEFPIPVDNGTQGITIEYKQFGVYLAFSPVVLENGRISLRVSPEVSELSNAGSVTLNGFVVPALSVRRATTTVELGSGQSFGIAGLVQNGTNQTISKFPGLGDVPVLGQLFRSDNFQRSESELVIIVTPYLVRPASRPVLADPTQGLEPPNDSDRILNGRNYSDLTGAAAAPGLAPARRKDAASRAGYLLD